MIWITEFAFESPVVIPWWSRKNDCHSCRPSPFSFQFGISNCNYTPVPSLQCTTTVGHHSHCTTDTGSCQVLDLPDLSLMSNEAGVNQPIVSTPDAPSLECLQREVTVCEFSFLKSDWFQPKPAFCCWSVCWIGLDRRAQLQTHLHKTMIG